VHEKEEYRNGGTEEGNRTHGRKKAFFNILGWEIPSQFQKGESNSLPQGGQEKETRLHQHGLKGKRANDPPSGGEIALQEKKSSQDEGKKRGKNRDSDRKNTTSE